MAMNKNDMHSLWQGSFLDGGNASWLEAMYESYLEDPCSVDSQWQEYFQNLVNRSTATTVETAHTPIKNYFVQQFLQQGNNTPQFKSTDSEHFADLEHERKQVKVLQLINAYRFLGHKKARLNPLQKMNRALFMMKCLLMNCLLNTTNSVSLTTS